MTKNKWLIVIICVLLTLSIVALLLVFLLPKNNKPSQLTLTCSDIVVSINDTTTIDVNVNYPTAVLTYQIDDTSVAQIEGNKIRGLSIGHTTLQVTATYKDQTVTKTANISVEANMLAFHLIPTQNCEAEGSILYFTSPASFTYRVYDNNGFLILNPTPSIYVTEGINYSNSFGQIVISSQTDGYITFTFYEQGSSVTVRLVIKDIVASI